MTYDQTRDSEQLSYLDDAIAEFISRYNFNVQSTSSDDNLFSRRNGIAASARHHARA
jgi:hypothetical protein